jgi:hypothetical protein
LLIAFNILIDDSNKDVRAGIAYGATHESQRKAEDRGVPVVKERLIQPCHLRLEQVEVDGIEEDIKGSRSAAEKGSPMPVIVLRVQQKVGAHDTHARGHDHQNQKYKQHEAIHVVHLVVPQTRE